MAIWRKMNFRKEIAEISWITEPKKSSIDDFTFLIFFFRKIYDIYLTEKKMQRIVNPHVLCLLDTLW